MTLTFGELISTLLAAVFAGVAIGIGVSARQVRRANRDADRLEEQVVKLADELRRLYMER